MYPVLIALKKFHTLVANSPTNHILTPAVSIPLPIRTLYHIPKPAKGDKYNGSPVYFPYPLKLPYIHFCHELCTPVSLEIPLFCTEIMAEDLHIITGSKTEQYETIIPQVLSIIADEPSLTANLANVAAALKEQFGWLWVGFYLVDSPEELVLGPFQGPVACTRIRKGKGVCGTAWQKAETVLVPDVEKFEGHIACSSASKSEIVVPIIKNGSVKGVFDADSRDLNSFDQTDKFYLERLMERIAWN